jgi:hypothetical protein
MVFMCGLVPKKLALSIERAAGDEAKASNAFLAAPFSSRLSIKNNIISILIFCFQANLLPSGLPNKHTWSDKEFTKGARA